MVIFPSSAIDDLVKSSRLNYESFVKSRIFQILWIPAFAGMTIKYLISDG